MICQRCQRSLRSKDGLKCSVCQSIFHLKCRSDDSKGVNECGDRAFQWNCSLCHNSANKVPENSNSKENLMNAISSLTEKFELVNKIQLPKLNSELSQIKSVTDRIVKQNDDLLRKMDELENRKSCDKRSGAPSHSYRRRNLNFTPRLCKSADDGDYMPMSSAQEKTVRFHTRRRSYLLNRMFHLLNRKSNNRKRHQ